MLPKLLLAQYNIQGLNSRTNATTHHAPRTTHHAAVVVIIIIIIIIIISKQKHSNAFNPGLPMSFTSLSSAALLFASLWLAYQLTRFLAKLVSVRTKFQRMQREGLPMPPHHPLFGHLSIVGSIMSKLPSDVHGHYLPRQISKAYPNLGPFFYIDTWPFGPLILAVTSAEAANQVTVAHSLPKFTMLREYMKPMTGGMDLTTLEGDEWKTWRAIFNPGFSINHLMTMVSQMMKDVLIFCEILEQRAATGEVFSMDPLTINLNLDIIGRLAL
ncbi:MAG: hypothetical protein Q9167_006423 [Letrouitia subvulpina]